MSISHDQFVEMVEVVFPDADNRGHFRNFTPEFVNCAYNPGRKYYTWQDNEGFKCVSFDTMFWEGHPNKPWLVQTGRGSTGYGNTIFEAVADEKVSYDNSFYNLTV
jgi:hypothetical protein